MHAALYTYTITCLDSIQLNALIEKTGLHRTNGMLFDSNCIWSRIAFIFFLEAVFTPELKMEHTANACRMDAITFSETAKKENYINSNSNCVLMACRMELSQQHDKNIQEKKVAQHETYITFW